MKFNTTFEYINYTLISLYNNIQQIEDSGLRDILLTDYNDLEDGIHKIQNNIGHFIDSMHKELNL